MNQPLNTGSFLSSLEAHDAKPLIFEYAGTRIQPGYHVTEVKRHHVSSLDCGANPETWSETVVQLMDVPGKPGDGFMTARKFRAILQKVHSRLPLEMDAPLTFECGDPDAPIGLFTAPSLTLEDHAVLVRLEPKRASCKPQDRWFEANSNRLISLETASVTSACCAPVTTSSVTAASGKGCC